MRDSIAKRHATISSIAVLFIFILAPALTEATHLTNSSRNEQSTDHVVLGQLERQRQEQQHPLTRTGWGVGLRGGSSFFSEDLDRSVNFLISGQLFYNIGGANSDGPWNMGVTVDWERHANLKNTDANLTTISLIPFIEFQKKYNRWSPYVTLGAGINFNSISNESSGNLGAKDTFAFRGGVGADVFLTKSLAFNAEAVWKLNNNTAGIDASTVQALLGLRWYFDR